LILFGEAVRDLPYMIYAIEEMGREGLGRTIDVKRGRFTLHEVLLNGKRLYCSEDRVLAQCEPGHLLLSRMPRPTHKVERVLLRLETPLRLKYRNRLHPELPFHLLVRAMLRRIASLNARFGEGEPDLDYKGLVRRAEKAREAASSLQWTDWARYSNRQEQKMLMGGLTGTIQYEGDLSEFIPLLHYSEKVHLGKATTFGLGRIRVEH
jgi:CRISPR/Cas system endoribonuclease Cas6 (RAMP superfamily)